MFQFLERSMAGTTLSAQVRCVWLMRSDEGSGTSMPIVPDGSVEVVLNLGDPMDEMDGASPERQPRAMLVGQPTRPVIVRPSGTLHLLGVRLQPWASRSFVAAPAAELANRSVDIESVGPRGFPALLDALEAASDDESRLDRLVAWLSGRMTSVAPRPRFIAEAVRTIQRRRPLPSVRTLAAELGVTTRTLQRAFAHDVGVGPKTLQRIARVQRAIGLSRAEEHLPWAAIAARTGYYDEAHLNLDFHAFAGCSPSHFAPRAETLTELMLESRSN